MFGTALRHGLGVDRACVELLIECGSDLDGPLNLAACFDRVELVEILLGRRRARGRSGIHGITPLQSAIYHGSRASADVLAAIELVPDAPWVAAGTGRVDRLEQFLTDTAGWSPTRTTTAPIPPMSAGCNVCPRDEIAQDVLDEALVHAAQNERPAAVAWLLEHGADPNACPYQGCGALHLAAAFGAIESVKLLIAGGIDIDRRNKFNGDNALGWAEYALERGAAGRCRRRGGSRPAARPRLAPRRLGRVQFVVIMSALRGSRARARS